MKHFNLATIAIAAAILTGCASGPTSAPQCDANSTDPACAKSQAAQKANAAQEAQQKQIEAEALRPGDRLPTEQQLALAQIFVGAIVGFLGGVVGLPAGVAGAAGCPSSGAAGAVPAGAVPAAAVSASCSAVGFARRTVSLNT